MTTEIIVKAHCGTEKEVKISITNETEITLQDGEESNSLYVYDDRELTVEEVEK